MGGRCFGRQAKIAAHAKLGVVVSPDFPYALSCCIESCLSISALARQDRDVYARRATRLGQHDGKLCWSCLEIREQRSRG
jgi:hypothetical protein